MKLKITMLLMLALGMAQVAFADSFSGQTGTGCGGGSEALTYSGNNGLSVSGSTDILYSGGQVTVTLTNCTFNPTSVSQNISDVYFTIAGSSGIASTQLVNSSGTVVTLNSNGSFTQTSGTITWNMIASGDSFHLTDLIGGSAPAETIIGAPNGSIYSNANNSLTGATHNPYALEIATFTFNCPGCSGDIGNVNISFGTTPSTPTPVPEPASVLLFGSGLSALGIFSRRKLRK